MAALARREIAVSRVTAVAFPTSLRRSVVTLHHHEPSLLVQGVPAFEGLGPFADDLLRGARLALGEIDKLCHYPTLGHIPPVAIPDRVLAAARRVRAAFDAPPPVPTDLVATVADLLAVPSP